MSLARLLSGCRDELECDFAESYGFSGELKDLTPRKAAVLAAGLRPDSRTACRLANRVYGISVGEEALINRLGEIAYFTAKAAGFKAKRPKPLDLTAREEKREVKGFDTAEDFERELDRIRRSA